jgi:hypothetical protein
MKPKLPSRCEGQSSDDVDDETSSAISLQIMWSIPAALGLACGVKETILWKMFQWCAHERVRVTLARSDLLGPFTLEASHGRNVAFRTIITYSWMAHVIVLVFIFNLTKMQT